jgi:DNA-binding LytR/AlgR family response regulator
LNVLIRAVAFIPAVFMLKIRTIILEDEAHWQIVLQRMADHHPLLDVIGVYASPMEALPAVTQDMPDLLLLDVEFAEINGIDFAKSLDNPPMIIFVTTHAHFAAKSYEADAVDYLVKPVKVERFLQAIDKVRRRMSPSSESELEQEDNISILANQFFFIKEAQGYVKINLTEVLYVKSLENYIQVVTTKGIYTTLGALNFVEQRLGKGFLRTHRSYLVNLEKVELYNSEVVVINGQSLPLGGQFAEKFKQEFIYSNLLKK